MLSSSGASPLAVRIEGHEGDGAVAHFGSVHDELPAEPPLPDVDPPELPALPPLALPPVVIVPPEPVPPMVPPELLPAIAPPEPPLGAPPLATSVPSSLSKKIG